MGERFPSVLPKDHPPTNFQFQQHEAEECRMLTQLWNPKRPIKAVRHPWPELPTLTSDQMIRFGGGLNHMVRRLYAALASVADERQSLHVELLDTITDMKVIAASAPLETETA